MSTTVAPEPAPAEGLPAWQAVLSLYAIGIALAAAILAVVAILFWPLHLRAAAPGQLDFSAALPATFPAVYPLLIMLGLCPLRTRQHLRGTLSGDRGLALLAWSVVLVCEVLSVTAMGAAFVAASYVVRSHSPYAVAILLGLFSAFLLLGMPGMIFARQCVDMERLKELAKEALGQQPRRIIARGEDRMIRR